MFDGENMMINNILARQQLITVLTWGAIHTIHNRVDKTKEITDFLSIDKLFEMLQLFNCSIVYIDDEDVMEVLDVSGVSVSETDCLNDYFRNACEAILPQS